MSDAVSIEALCRAIEALPSDGLVTTPRPGTEPRRSTGSAGLASIAGREPMSADLTRIMTHATSTTTSSSR